MTTKERKIGLRREITARIEDEGDEAIACESAAIADILPALPEWRNARTIFAFLSMKHEVDTFEMIGRAFSDGKRLGVPRMYNNEIRFHMVDSAEGPWDVHPYGIREPQPQFPTADFAEASLYPLLVVTPGLAFDLSGRRLGHGRGYYDKLFAALAQTTTSAAESRSIGAATKSLAVAVAVCATCQIVDEVPTGDFDIPVDIIVTGDGVEYYADDLRRQSP